MRRRVAGNLGWMLAERGLQVGCGIAIVAMLARALGPDGFAHFQYAQAVVTIASSVALICGGEVVVPRLVRLATPQAQHGLLAHALALRAAGALLGYLLMCGYLWLAGADASVWPLALTLGIAILVREPAGVVTAWMQAHTHNRPGMVFSLISLSIKLALVSLLFLAGREATPAPHGASLLADHAPTLYAATFALEAVLLGGMLVAYYLRRVPHRAVSPDPLLARELLGAGTLFWASFMMMMAARRVDQLILQPVVTAAEFSAYAATMQILDNYTMAATIIAAGVAPIYVYGQSRMAAARRNVAWLALGLGVAGLGGAALIAATSDWIVALLYGERFHAAAELLRVAAFASALVFADAALTLVPVYLRKPQWVAAKWAGTLIVVLLFDLIMVPRHGAWGALAGYAISNAFAVLAGLLLWWRARATRSEPAWQQRA